MKKTVRILALACLVALIVSTACSCAPYYYEAHGIGDYKYDVRYNQWNFNSEVEIDVFPGIEPLIDEYPYLQADYDYSCQEEPLPFRSLERGIYYFKYTESDYEAAKAYCRENLKTLGDEALEEYNGYRFYDFYGKRNKEEYYHGDDYPQSFKRVAFQDEKKVIVFFGIHTAGSNAKELAQDVEDWEGFLRKYFFEFYDFDQ